MSIIKKIRNRRKKQIAARQTSSDPQEAAGDTPVVFDMRWGVQWQEMKYFWCVASDSDRFDQRLVNYWKKL